MNPRLHHLLTTRGIEAPFRLQAANAFFISPQRDPRFFTGVVAFGFQIQTLKAENVARQYHLLTGAEVKADFMPTAAGNHDPGGEDKYARMRQQRRKLTTHRDFAASDCRQHDNYQHQQAKRQRDAIKIGRAHRKPSPAHQTINHGVERPDQHDQQDGAKEQQRRQNERFALSAAQTRRRIRLPRPPAVQNKRCQT